ncbi:MAG TPA: hypothetical protein VGD98_10830 [Ktedonobacteraceae bacterium]
MNPRSLHFKARRVTRFILVQFIALSGSIAVELFFALSPFGLSLPFSALILTEALWWLALLLIMLRLFLLEYNRFVSAALELEETHRILKQRTTSLLQQMHGDIFPDERTGASLQPSQGDN